MTWSQTDLFLPAVPEAEGRRDSSLFPLPGSLRHPLVLAAVSQRMGVWGHARGWHHHKEKQGMRDQARMLWGVGGGHTTWGDSLILRSLLLRPDYASFGVREVFHST